MESSHAPHRATIWPLLRIWVRIGLQSFGGGASTQLMIRREFVEKRGWVGDAELGQMWNLCLFTPGINLIALAILIGRKLGGRWGIVASMVGMLVPSATITCLLAAALAAVRDNTSIHAVLRGIVPATAGMMGVVAVGFARPLLARAKPEGATPADTPRRTSLRGRGRMADGLAQPLLSAALILLAAVALIAAQLSIIAVLGGAAVLGVALFTPARAQPPSDPP